MRLTPSQLPAHLARGLGPLYVIGGDEPLLVTEALDALRAAARKAGYSEREVLDADRYFDWQRLLESCASLSLFATRRIVEVRLLGSGPGVEGGKVLRQLCESPPQDVLLIVVAGELEWRERSGGWYAALESAGVGCYAERLKDRALHDWLAARLKAAGVDADADAVRLLAERTEGNLLACAQDIEKLRLLFPGQRIGVEALAEAVADSARFEAFDLSDRMLAGDATGAARSLARLREEGAAVPEILGALAWSLRTLAQAAIIHARIRDAQAACEQARVRRAQIAAYSRAVARVRAGDALDYLARAARVDERVKTGAEALAWEELLTLVLDVSGAGKKRAA